MVASKSAQTATPGPGSRARVNARAKGRVRTTTTTTALPIRSRNAPASEQSVAAAAALIDRHRIGVAHLEEHQTLWGRKLFAAAGAMVLTAVTGVFFAALIAASFLGAIVAILNAHR
jgi:hypothetical protein